MNSSKCTDLDYINFLIATSTVFSCTEAARCYPSTNDAPSHDCFTRLLQKQPLDTEPLWAEVRKFVTLKDGFLIVDDTVLDKPYSEKIGFQAVSKLKPFLQLDNLVAKLVNFIRN